jgi:hypothetical protein
MAASKISLLTAAFAIAALNAPLWLSTAAAGTPCEEAKHNSPPMEQKVGEAFKSYCKAKADYDSAKAAIAINEKNEVTGAKGELRTLFENYQKAYQAYVAAAQNTGK